MKSGDGVEGLAHPITAPPPKEKKLRKNELAANAIDSPNTIWIRRRKPPEVSPNASDRPVVMMMITAMILDTGPCTESRICCSGCSHGMFEPAPWAGAMAKLAMMKMKGRSLRRIMNAHL